MNYYEIIIRDANNGKVTLFFPTTKSLSNAKRHATTMADRLGRWKYINLYYVNESADVREFVAQRFKQADSWIDVG